MKLTDLISKNHVQIDNALTWLETVEVDPGTYELINERWKRETLGDKK